MFEFKGSGHLGSGPLGVRSFGPGLGVMSPEVRLLGVRWCQIYLKSFTSHRIGLQKLIGSVQSFV